MKFFIPGFRVGDFFVSSGIKTIISLTGLLIITTGMSESGYFSSLARSIIKRYKTERGISLFMVLVSVFLATFLTNDIALFIVIPLTLYLKRYLKEKTSVLIIFEAIGVNVGSSLTPIGNPQNLFLWHLWDISFIKFVLMMLPLFFLLTFVLLGFIFLSFKKKEVILEEKEIEEKYSKDLLIFSIFALIVFIISIERDFIFMVFPLFFFYLIFWKKVVLRTDWKLPVFFAGVFLVFHFLSELSFISRLFLSLNLSSSYKNSFLSSVFLSQIISNVPATIVISKFSKLYKPIAYGVNVGGNGIIFSSFANLIALRLSKDIKILKNFHRYSIPYFLATTFLSLIFFW